MDCQYTSVTHSSTTHTHTRRARNQNRNFKPCGNCSYSKVRCNVSPPYSTHLCQRCEKAGLKECPPHVPRINGRRRERHAAPYSWSSPPSSPSGTNGYPIYAHQNFHIVGTNEDPRITSYNNQNTPNARDFVGLVPTEAQSDSQFMPTAVGQPIHRRLSGCNGAEVMANNTSTTIFGHYSPSTSNAVNENATQTAYRSAMHQADYSSAVANWFDSLDRGDYGVFALA